MKTGHVVDQITYDVLTHPDCATLIESFVAGKILRHEFLEKFELIIDQIKTRHEDPHVLASEKVPTHETIQ